MFKITGKKYEETKDLDITEIAKLVRKDLKPWHMQGVRFSVRIERYSMGQSLGVQVIECPFVCYEPEKMSIRNNLTTRGKALYNDIDRILRSYNYDDSDSMSDYYSVRYHADIRLPN